LDTEQGFIFVSESNWYEFTVDDGTTGIKASIQLSKTFIVASLGKSGRHSVLKKPFVIDSIAGFALAKFLGRCLFGRKE